MNVLVLLSNPIYVDPRVYFECQALIEKGHKVSLISWDRKSKYEKYDVYDDIKVVNLKNSLLMKTLPSDVFRNYFWWKGAFKEAVRQKEYDRLYKSNLKMGEELGEESGRDYYLKAYNFYKQSFNFDVVHCNDLDTLQTGIWLKEKYGVKVVYDAHENFPYMIEGYVPNFVFRYAQNLEKKLLKGVDYVITTSEPMKDYLRSITDKPIMIVMNCKDLIYNEYKPSDNKIFTLIYIGIMMKERFFPDIVELVGEMSDVKLIIAGKREGLYDEVKELAKKYSNIEFKGVVDTHDIVPLTREADATFLFMRKLENKKYFQDNLVNKFFESLVAGRPFLTTKGRYMGELVEKLNCGIAVNYDKESVKELILKLKNDKELCETLGKNALKQAKGTYNWEKEKKKLISVYENI